MVNAIQLPLDIPLITVLSIRINASPQSQTSETGVVKQEGAEKFPTMTGAILRMGARRKNSSVLEQPKKHQSWDQRKWV